MDVSLRLWTFHTERGHPLPGLMKAWLFAVAVFAPRFEPFS